MMDSRLLNMFHEDPFEGNLVKYEPEPSFWSIDNDDLQLTDSLNGILPIAPTDDAMLKRNEEELETSKNLLIYNEFMEQQLSDRDANLLNAQVYQVINDSDMEATLPRQGGALSALADYDHQQDDVQSECSNSTFRTRTDSSSIGDYESHTSDYDDDDDDEDVEEQQIVQPTINAKESERKSRTMSINTVCSDADGFGLNIDVNNFDLAEFITKDDFALSMQNARAKETVVATTKLPSAAAPITIQKQLRVTETAPPPTVVTSAKLRDSDDDSDSIIDVETIDVDESEWTASHLPIVDDLCYVDNVKADPSWSPKQTKKQQPASSGSASSVLVKEHKSEPVVANSHKVTITEPSTTITSAAKPKASNHICLVPSKKQCDFLKRKVGVKTLGKTTKTAAKKVPDVTKITNAKPSTVIATGLGLGGKNLALLKHQCDSVVVPEQHVVVAPPKRKLNLEEYKQRRGGGTTQATLPPKQAKLESIKAVAAPTASAVPVSPQKIAISNIVHNLKCPAAQPVQATDPITAAKNKVLRMLEMKRAQQIKIIDSRVSAKVPRVTKLPPLREIVKDTYCLGTEEVDSAPASSSKLQANYEEIIIVSASCNTDITIPPQQLPAALQDKTTTPSTRSLLKSSVLLYNMSTCNANAGQNVSNSLIASIQSEVVKQTNCALTTPVAALPAAKQVQHGEDMIIMHLPKDRVRPQLCSMGTQTELQAEFPLLTLPTTRKSRERTRRSYRKRRGSTTTSQDSSSTGSSTSSCSSPSSSRARSNSNSNERLRQADAAAACGSSSIGCGGYSSRSTQRHRSSVSSSSYSEAGRYERQQRRQRRTSYNKRRSRKHARSISSTSGSEYSDRSRSPHRPQRSRSRSRSHTPTRAGDSYNNNRRSFIDRNVSQPAVEERRIVYVGRIEQETTKEQLRRKFLPYGTIKQITIHYKENGMKYGFVTFERAQDAFAAIDSSDRDVQLNMYDISFGGRRAFCRATYADLDNAGINNYQSYVFPKAAPLPSKQEDSFETLLLKMKAKLSANKPAAATEVAPATQITNNKQI